MYRCSNCGETNIDLLEPLDSGLVFCAGCDRATKPGDDRPRYEPEPRTRKDLDE